MTALLARRRLRLWLRLIGAGAITLVFSVSMLDQSESPATLGARLFGNLNATLFAAIWILVPLLTADCISQSITVMITWGDILDGGNGFDPATCVLFH